MASQSNDSKEHGEDECHPGSNATIVADVCSTLESIAPLRLAEAWDNVGLLLGDPERRVERLMTCLTLSEAVVAEGITRRADMIVSHHPLPFRPLSRITTSDPTGRLLWSLAGSQTSVYSPHTAWDNAPSGINDLIASACQLREVKPLVAKGGIDSSGIEGSGRVGQCAMPSTADQLRQRLSQALGLKHIQVLGDTARQCATIGIVCGSGASYLEVAHQSGCDAFITGEANYHQCLEAHHRGMLLVLLGHHGSERFSMEILANILQQRFRQLEIWASEAEFDPTVTR